MKTPQVDALPGMTPLGIKPRITPVLQPEQIISFKQRCGTKITGVVVKDFGHALLIEVCKANRANLRRRTMLFPTNDMEIV